METIYKGDKKAEICLILAADSQEDEFVKNVFSRIQKECPDVRLMMAAVLVDNWNRDLSPWKAPAVFGKEDFGDGATITLKTILEEIIPEIQEKWVADTEKIHYIVGGYSLAGLFSLWAVYQTAVFSACAAASPSVWFPDWLRYAGEHPVLTDRIYLSLGKKEEKTRNPVMARVGVCITKQQELLSGKKVCLEWEEGNHFTDPEGRCVRGFVWCVRQLMEGGVLMKKDTDKSISSEEEFRQMETMVKAENEAASDIPDLSVTWAQDAQQDLEDFIESQGIYIRQ